MDDDYFDKEQFEKSLDSLKNDFRQQGASEEMIESAIAAVRTYERIRSRFYGVEVKDYPVDELKALFEVPEIFRNNPYLYIDMRKSAHYNAFLLGHQLGYRHALQGQRAWELYDLIRSDRRKSIDSDS
jgi:hypothetical protein